MILLYVLLSVSIIEKDIDLKNIERVEISANTEKITIIGDEKNYITLRGEDVEFLDEKILKIKKRGGVLYISVNIPEIETKTKYKFGPISFRGNIKRPAFRAFLQVKIPKEKVLIVKSTSSDVCLKNLSKKQNVDLVSGSIELSNIGGEGHFETTSGDIRGNFKGNKLKASTISGDIYINGRGDFNISATSGDIRLDGEGSLKVSTISGDVRGKGEIIDGFVSTTSGDVLLNPISFKKMRIETISGDVRMNLSKTVSLSVDVSTTSGALECSISLDKVRVTKHKLIGKRGNGENSLEISTVSGDISIGGE
jgi:DUF4097 and DUF4098 domain-containing protein YvlB